MWEKCDDIPDLEANPVYHRREELLIPTLDGQQEADLPGQCKKSAAFPLKERLPLSV